MTSAAPLTTPSRCSILTRFHTRRSILLSAAAALVGLSQPANLSARSQPVESSKGGLSDPQIVAALRTRLEALAARDLFSGSVLLAKHGKVLFAGTYGYAYHAFKVPNRVN